MPMPQKCFSWLFIASLRPGTYDKNAYQIHASNSMMIVVSQEKAMLYNPLFHLYIALDVLIRLLGKLFANS